MDTNRLVTIGALSERTEVNIETIRYYDALVSCRSLPAARADTGSTPKNISGAWSSSDGHANWVSPLRTCARFFGSWRSAHGMWEGEAHHRKARC